jgi:hypothetical protein
MSKVAIGRLRSIWILQLNLNLGIPMSSLAKVVILATAVKSGRNGAYLLAARAIFRNISLIAAGTIIGDLISTQ